MDDMAIKKAIFLVAGFGTRFLPATKAQPKEMLPIVDKPLIQILVEEVIEAGIEEIIFVTGRGKNSIENHFDKSYELEQTLVEKGKRDLLEQVSNISNLAKFAYVRQPVQNGDGSAIMCAAPFVDNNEPVLYVFPDYIMPRTNNTFKKIIEAYQNKYEVILGVDEVDVKDVHKFGTMSWESTDESHLIKLKSFIEKPPKDCIPDGVVNNNTAYINLGYGVITPLLWKYLAQAESTTSDGEIRIADALTAMLEDGHAMYAVTPVDRGYDCGSKLGFLKATVDHALQREDLQEEFAEFLKTRVSEIDSI